MDVVSWSMHRRQMGLRGWLFIVVTLGGVGLIATSGMMQLIMIDRPSNSMILNLRAEPPYRDLTEEETWELWGPDDVECVGWRQTADGTPEGRVRAWTYSSCNDTIARTDSGFCLFRIIESGDLVRVMRKYNQRTYIPEYTDMKCSQGIEFHNFKILAHQHQEDAPFKTSPAHKKPTRGIAFAVGPGYIIEAYANVKWLREVGCTLPIELYHNPNELEASDPRLQNLSQDPLVTLREVNDAAFAGWFIKIFILYHSKFDQVLVLDVDSFPIRDPSYLFEFEGFKKTGAIFYKDRTHPINTIFGVVKTNIIWDLVGIDFVDEFEGESGEIFVDRKTCPKCIQILTYLVRNFDPIIGKWNLVYGDKDLFRIAWRMAQHDFYYDVLPPGEVGYKSTERIYDREDHNKYLDYCSGTMIQFDPYGDFLFFHRSHPKFHKKEEPKPLYQYYCKFIGDDPRTQYMSTLVSLNEDSGDWCGWKSTSYLQYFEVNSTQDTEIPAMENRLIELALEARKLGGFD